MLLDLRRTAAERKGLNHVDDSGSRIDVLEKLVEVCEANDNQFNLKWVDTNLFVNYLVIKNLCENELKIQLSFVWQLGDLQLRNFSL